MATVASTDDPEKRGRIRVRCPTLLGDDETELPMWVEPTMTWGLFVVPNPGEVVEIDVAVSGALDDSPKQTSIEALDPRWHGGRFFDIGADSPQATPHEDLTGTNYGKRRGIQTPKGHTLVFDDTDGQESVRLSWRDTAGKLHYMEITNDTMTVSLNGATLELKNAGALTTAKVGDGSMHVPIVETLQALWATMLARDTAFTTALITYLGLIQVDLTAVLAFAGIVPPIAVSAAGAVVFNGVAATNNPPTPAWDPTINSTKVSIPNG